MRLFSITSEDTFKEYVETSFQAEYREAVLEDWLEANPHCIVEDGSLLVIGRQVTTNLGSTIDLLAVDRHGAVAVIELKRDRTPRETLAQALEYASFAELLDYEQLESIYQTYVEDESANLAQYHRESFELSPDEAIVFNRDQRIVIVGQRVTPEIRQTSTFLRHKDVRVTCVEFSLFEREDGRRLLSSDIVVGKEASRPTRISSGSQPKTTERQFMESLDEHGRPVFKRLLGLARANGYPIHWGAKGFSLNVDLDGIHAAICYCYPPHSVFRQSIYTALVGHGGLVRKIELSEEEVQGFLSDTQKTGLFAAAGGELKCLIEREFSTGEIDKLIAWSERTASFIKQHGLREETS